MYTKRFSAQPWAALRAAWNPIGPEREASMIDLAGHRILIIEDEVMIALLLETMIQQLGGVVGAKVSRLADALSALHHDAQGFDAATLDIDLAGEAADEVAVELDAQHVPFILVTGYEASLILERFPGRPVVLKPVILDELAAAFRTLMLHPKGL
jgi:DNA-binding response OmpR family regulator